MIRTVSQREQSSRRCYEHLRHLLMYGQLAPGIRLGEVEWAARLKVHRSALREAMALLAHEGLLVRGQRGGFFTPVLEQRDLEEIWEARSIIEVGAIRLIAARNLPPEAFDLLATICDTMQALCESAIWLGFAEADRKFHETLVKLSGNERLLHMYIRAALPHRVFSSASDPHQVAASARVTLDEHREIHQLLVTGRFVEATQRLEEHLNTTGRLLRVN